MKLENLNLVELDAREVQETEGGVIFSSIVIYTLVTLYLAGTVGAVYNGYHPHTGQPLHNY